MKRLHFLARQLLACTLLGTTLSWAGAVPTLSGQWHATLQTGTGPLALEMTVRELAPGAYSASLESIDQAPGQAIPVDLVTLEQDRLTLTMKALGASYEGRHDAASDSWKGEWRQGRTLPLQWKPGPMPSMPVITGFDGEWRATLDRNGTKLRLVLHIASNSRGTRARMDSPDAGLSGMEVTDLERNGDSLRFRVPLASVVFDGSLDDATGSMRGRWRRQGMPEMRVQFIRSASAAQDAPSGTAAVPGAPSYSSVPVRFANHAAGITLSGTLSRPQGAGPFAAAVLISGTGPHDRDGSMAGHKPFATIAGHMARRGIAVLRFDERGVGESEGVFARATNADFAADVRAALHFLAQQDGIAPNAIGLLGHSQGGAVASLAAQGEAGVAYLVLLAAPGTPIGELLLVPRRLTGVSQGLSGKQLRRNESALRTLFAASARAPDRAAARTRLDALLTPARLKDMGVTALQKPALVDEISSDWLRDLLRYDVRRALADTKVPVLALNGSMDRQVPPAANLAGIGRALAGKRDVSVVELPGLNHLFQHARTGRMSEYAELKEDFAASAIETIIDWISARFPPSSHS